MTHTLIYFTEFGKADSETIDLERIEEMPFNPLDGSSTAEFRVHLKKSKYISTRRDFFIIQGAHRTTTPNKWKTFSLSNLTELVGTIDKANIVFARSSWKYIFDDKSKSLSIKIIGSSNKLAKLNELGSLIKSPVNISIFQTRLST